jgi:hypothetical protein
VNLFYVYHVSNFTEFDFEITSGGELSSNKRIWIFERLSRTRGDCPVKYVEQPDEFISSKTEATGSFLFQGVITAILQDCPRKPALPHIPGIVPVGDP